MSAKKKVTKTQWVLTISLGVIILAFFMTILFVFFFNPQRTFTVTETFRVTSEIGSDTYLRITLPMSGGYQEIGNLVVEGAEHYTIEYFNGWRDLTARVPATGYEVAVTISFTATLFRNVQPWHGEVRTEYTMPQQFVDSDNDAIIDLAEQLRGENDLQTARNIHDHVNNLLSWPTGSRTNVDRLYASELLDYQIGVCGDFANLMVALLRSAGIPARNISGLALQIPLRRAQDWGHPGGAHGWVEFYADGKWHFADPSWGLFNRNRTDHLSFGTSCMYLRSDFQQNRLQELKDEGFVNVGGMTAPLRFILFSTDENASVIPRGEVSHSWFR